MPLILDRDSRVWFGELGEPAGTTSALGAITAYSFDSAEVEGAEPTVQVALVGWWLIADGGHTVQPGFWTFTGEECESVTAWCKAIQTDNDWGNFGLMALADLLWARQTDEAKEAFAPPIPLDLPIDPEEESTPQVRGGATTLRGDVFNHKALAYRPGATPWTRSPYLDPPRRANQPDDDAEAMERLRNAA